MGAESESRQAFRELFAFMQKLDDEYLSEERRITEAADVAEGEHMLLHLLKAGIDIFVDNDAGRPRFAPLSGPTLKFGGEGADNPAFFAPLDTRRRYRIRGKRKGEVYISVTVYKGKEEGDWNDGVVSALNHNEFEIKEDGSYEIDVGLEPRPGSLHMDPGAANCVMSRHYYENEICGIADPEIHPEIDIETLDDPIYPRPVSPASLSSKLRAAIRFMHEQTLARPPMSPDRTPSWFSQPEQWTPTEGGGAGAVDNAYCAGLIVLPPDKALVIEGRFPECVYANVMIWNRYMQGLDYRYRQTSLNRKQMEQTPEGRFRLIVAHQEPGLPNWLDTEGRMTGILYWRFLLPEGDIEQPTCEVVPFDSLQRP
jgi:hypothetical protein